MNTSDPQRDPLDDLLAAARWPEADAERAARLRDCWEAQRPRPLFSMGRVAIRCAAVAAALLLAVGVAWWSWRDRGDDAPGNGAAGGVAPEVARPAEPETSNDVAPSPKIAIDRSPQPHRTEKPVIAATPIGRPATPLEEVLFQAWQAQQRAATWEQDAAVEAAIAAIRYDDSDDETTTQANVAAAARPLFARRAYCQRRLLENARYFDGTRRDAALKLLGHVGTTGAIRDIVPLVDVERARETAVAAILRIATPEKIALLARRERDVVVRRGLLSTLAIAGDVRSVGALLACVAHDPTRPTALNVVADLQPLPTASLLAWLESADAARSTAAAAALATANDPAAIERLVRLARSGNASGAALVALVGSEQPAAREFVAAAKRTQLVSAVYEAQYQWRALQDAALSRRGVLPNQRND